MSLASTPFTRPAGVGVALAIIVLVYTPAGFGDVERVWAAAALLAVGLVLGEALAEVSSSVGFPGVVPIGLLVVLSAMYLCVPETNQFVVAALVPVALLGVEVARRKQLGLEWYALAAASVAWAGMFGSAGRQSALIGALFAWCPVLLPWLIGRLTGVRSRNAMLASMVIGAIAALIFSRTGGIWNSGVTAAFAAGVIAFFSLGASRLIANRLRRRRRRRRV